MEECGVALDDSDPAAEAAHRLCELETNVAAAEDKDVCGDCIEFERFNMCEWISGGQTGDAVIEARCRCR